MKDIAAIGEDSFCMLLDLIRVEGLIKGMSAEEINLYIEKFESHTAVGRELLDRKFVKWFCTPKSINGMIRKALIDKMLEFEQLINSGKISLSKGDKFESILKNLLILNYKENSK